MCECGVDTQRLSFPSTAVAICESVVYSHRAILLILRVPGVLVLGGSDHMEVEHNKGGEEIRQDGFEREEEFNGWKDNAQSDT